MPPICYQNLEHLGLVRLEEKEYLFSI